MLVVIIVLAYVAGAAASMYWSIKLNRRFDVVGEFDISTVAACVACFWPLAFPVFAAYLLAHSEE